MKRNTTNIIGRQPVIEALRDGIALERIFLLRNASGEGIEEIRQLAQRQQIPINAVPIEKLNGITRANHQGVIAINSLVQYLELQDCIDHIVSTGETPLIVMLDGITDVRNIGAIARTALCCGAQLLIIPEKGIAALNEEAMKSSAGALQKVMVSRVSSLLKALDTLHLNGIQVFASEMKGSVPIMDADFKQPVCIIMGSEDKGIQPFLIKASDQKISIPMKSSFDSFNVGVAAGIILFHASMQRLEKQ